MRGKWHKVKHLKYGETPFDFIGTVFHQRKAYLVSVKADKKRKTQYAKTLGFY